MRLVVKLVIALDLLLEVREGVEVMQAQVLLADPLHHLEVSLSVCCHKSIN